MSCIPVTGNLNNATASTTPAPTGYSSFADVWYSFVATDNIVTAKIAATNIIYGLNVAIYSGSCGSLSLVSSGYDSTTAVGLTVSSTYYIRVMRVSPMAGSNDTFQLCLRQKSQNTACWTQVSAGDSHTMAIKSDGTLWAWGDNSYGQLGLNILGVAQTPVQVGNATNWSKVRAGSAFTIALKTDGTMWAWGYNGDGALGDGTGIDKTTPIQVGTSNIWVDVAAQSTGNHVLAIKSNGTLWAWGFNGGYQLGDGTTTNRLSPVQIGLDSNWSRISVGGYVSVALKSNGTLWTWGSNTTHQLGGGQSSAFAFQSVPTQIGADSAWRYIACGFENVLAIKADSSLWGWGNNDLNVGQLGLGSTQTFLSSPAMIATSHDWRAVAAGYNQMLLLKHSGTYWSSGYNASGQIGNGTTSNVTTISQVGTGTNWLGFSGGTSHTVAVTSGGSLFTNGDNTSGQLGDGTVSASAVPKQIGSSCSSNSCVTWSGAPPTDTLILNATNYLCNLGIIQGTQDAVWNQLPIRRHDLAKIVYLGLFGTNASTIAEKFPTPFYDLQDSSVYYYKYAKALSYLEFGDGISPFTRSFAHFRPGDSITRKDAMKVFAEAWNLPRASSGSSPFTDIVPTEYAFPWIKTLNDSGIVYGSGGLFNPSGISSEKLSRNDAFIILYRMLRKLRKPVVHDSDFYKPHLMTAANLSSLLGLDGGAFNSYSQSSFNIPGLMPLTFGEAYSSTAVDLPEEFFTRKSPPYGTVYSQQPLGFGWTHTYNSYIIPIFGDSANVNTDDRLLVHWADGTIHLYKLPVTPGAAYVCQSYGVYDTLYVGTSGYEIKRKNGTIFKFDPYFIAPSVAFIAPLKKVVDRHNNQLSLSYVASGNVPLLSTVTDPAGRSLQFAYADTAHPYCITSISAITGSITRTVSFSYDSLGDLNTYTDPRGNCYQYTYGQTWLDAHLLTKVKLPRGNEINSAYQQRKLTSLKFNNTYQQNVGLATDYSSSANPNQTGTITTQQGSQTLSLTSRRDQRGNLTALSGNGIRYSAQYADAANPRKPTSVADSSSGITVITAYDSKGNLISVTKQAGTSALSDSNTYNANNDLISHTDARGQTTTYTYSGYDLTSVQRPIGTTNIVYNSDGTVSSVTNPSGITTTYTYNSYGNLKTTTLAGIYTDSATYDDASRVIKTCNAAGIDTRYTYDNNDNRLTELFDSVQMNILTSFGFDNNNNLTSVTNALNNVTSLTYSNEDELLTQSFGGNTRTNAYNSDGSLQSVTTPNNVQLSYTYDTYGRITSDGYASYTYNTDNTLATITHNGKALSYNYDAFKRVSAVSYNDYSGNTVQYQYDNNGNILQIVYPGNVLTINYSYDNNNRLTSVTDGSSNLIASYTYLADGRLSQQTNGNGTTVSYFYDATGRLDSIANLYSNGNVLAAYGFSSDVLGNHLMEREYIPGGLAFPTLPSLTANGTHSYNRTQSYGGQSYIHDNNGNNTAVGSTTTYNWDAKDNLLSYNSSATTATYAYDGTEARRQRNNTRFVLDVLNGNNVLMETDMSGNPTAIYVHGLGLVCRINPANGNKHYYHCDYRGSTIAITDGSQNITHRYRYGAFGEQYGVQETGFSNAFRYVGKYGVMYEDSLLYFMRARYYNPEIGRFLGEDPVWRTNLFVYCGNNPMNLIDPTGLLGSRTTKNLTEASGKLSDYLKNHQNTAASNLLSYINSSLNANPDTLKISLTSILKSFYDENNLSLLLKENGDERYDYNNSSMNVAARTYKELIAISTTSVWGTSKANANSLRLARAINYLVDQLIAGNAWGVDYWSQLTFY